MGTYVLAGLNFFVAYYFIAMQHRTIGEYIHAYIDKYRVNIDDIRKQIIMQFNICIHDITTLW